jgi:hypothetical protein
LGRRIYSPSLLAEQRVGIKYAPIKTGKKEQTGGIIIILRINIKRKKQKQSHSHTNLLKGVPALLSLAVRLAWPAQSWGQILEARLQLGKNARHA